MPSMKDYFSKKKLIRIVIDPPKDSDGLFTDTGKYDEVVESHVRDTFFAMFQYADRKQGNSRTFDENGNYICGDCNKYEPNACLAVEGKISGDHGSCRHWEDKCAGDSELDFGEKIERAAAVYGETKADGFGCHRCKYSVKAKAVDSQGRTLFCKRGAFHVDPNACCALNESRTNAGAA